MGLMQQMFAGIPTTSGSPIPPVTSDSLFNYVSLLLSGDTITGTPTFISDAGTNNLLITPMGSVRNDNFSPFQGSGYYGAQFNGTTDYLSVANNSALNLGSSDFTVEAWIMPTQLGAEQAIIGKHNNQAGNGEWLLELNSSNLPIFYFSSTGSNLLSVTGTVAIQQNIWTHIAVTRSGSTFSIYVNGTLNVTASNAAAIYASTTSLNIGRYLATAASTALFSGYISNARVVKGTVVYTENFVVPLSPLTAITNTSLLTCQSSLFKDNSTNNFAITVGGTAKVSYNQPFTLQISNASGYFNGTSDYLSLPSTLGNGMGSQNYTFETWVWADSTGAGSNRQIAYINGATNGYVGIGIQITSGGLLGFALNGNLANNITSAWSLYNQWVHIAVVRNGSTFTAYVNGSSVGTYSNAAAVSDFTVNTIGSYNNTFFYWKGYISNTRLVVGTAVYTEPFTPPTSPLTAISNTSLLTLQFPAPASTKTFIDSSTLNNLITPTGAPSQGTFSPYSQTGWSGNFNGSTDYIQTNNAALTLGTGDFTIEAWVYSASGTNNGVLQMSATAGGYRTNTTNTIAIAIVNDTLQVYMANGNYTSSTLPVLKNTWNHLALVRSSGITKAYVNGVLETGFGTAGSVADTVDYTGTYMVIGGYWSTSYNLVGNISNLRIVKGTAVYTGSFTPSTTPLTAISGTALLILQNNRFKDNSSNNIAFTVTGTPSIRAVSPFNPTSAWSVSTNGGSIYLESSSTQYLSAPASTAYDITSGNFTVEAYVYMASYNTMANSGSHIVTNFVSTGGWSFYISGVNAVGALGIQTYSANAVLDTKTATIPAGSMPLGTWNHVAAVRNGANIYFYLNGTQIGTTQPAPSAAPAGMDLTVGIYKQNLSYTGNAKWYISSLRITKGAAVYTTNFTPPTAPLTPTANTTLLLNGSNIGIVDSTGKNDITTTGSAQTSTAQKKYGSNSIFFNGTTDYITMPNANQMFALGSGDFTVELWVYPTSASSPGSFICNQYNWATATGNWCFYASTGAASTIYFNAGGANHASSTTATIPLNQWSHIAYTRTGGLGRFFLNGTMVGTAVTDTTTYANAAGSVYIGDKLGAGGKFFGYMDDIRITKGVARYTASFTPPTAPFPVQ